MSNEQNPKQNLDAHTCSMIGRIEGLIATVEAHIIATAASTKRVEDLIWRHNGAIYGNGDAGLKTKVGVLEAEADKRGKFNLMAAGGFLGFLGMLIIEAWKSLKG